MSGKRRSRASETHCWNCNALQKFVPRTRQTTKDIIEVYIACSVCKKEKRLYLSTPSIELKRRRMARIRPNVQDGTRSARIYEELSDQIRIEALSYGLDPSLLLHG